MPYATNSSGNYSGTIVVSPIRPVNPNSNISTAFSNEVKGSYHTYETISERNSIPESRRDWGMLCTVYNDSTSSNNKTYILKYGLVSTNLLDNTNWIEFVPSGANFVPTGGEWINSVQIISATPSVLTDGYRYLVSIGGIGQFSGQDWKIAQYNSVGSTFSFVTPTDGMTVRVDNEPNVVYKYQGIYSTGRWVKEYLNQVRYLNAFSSNGMSYSATSSQTALSNYNDSVYYVNFNMTSSGTVSLNIDSLGFRDVKKLQNNNFFSIGVGEILPGIQYQLVNNSGFLQTVLPSSSTTTIGSAEDGTYTDGLFTDFTPTTPIGVAIDRVNEALKTLFGLTGSSSTVVPFVSPFLSSWSATGSFVNGGISFDSTDSGFTGATSSPYGAVLKAGTFSSINNPYRLGIRSRFLQPITGTQYYGDISGFFNSNVPATSGYPAGSFCYASSGTFSLILNGFTISSVDLSPFNSIDTTMNGATSGMSFSVVSAGINLPEAINRTGSYLIKKDNPYIVEGYNYFFARHDFNTSSFILPRYEFIADGSTQSITVTSNLGAPNNITTQFLSGIQYINSFSISFNATLQNLVKNSFSTSQSSLVIKDVVGFLNPPMAPQFNYFNIISQSIDRNLITSPSISYNVNPNFSIITNTLRLINGTIGFKIDALRTVQGTFSGATASSGNWFIDTWNFGNSSYHEFFSSELYRKPNGITKFDTSLNSTSTLIASTWSSSNSLLSNNGLQVIGGRLVYPTFDFSSPGNSVSNPNFSNPQRNYTNCRFSTINGHNTTDAGPSTNYRTYTRYFQTTTSSNNFQFEIYCSDVNSVRNNIVSVYQPLIGNNIWMEIKAYGNSSSISNWFSLNTFWLGPPNLQNGVGCLIAPPGLSGSRLILPFTSGAGPATNKILFRITAGPDWTDFLEQIRLVSI